MPDKRSPNKVRFGGYVDAQTYRMLAREAKKSGWTGGVFGYFVHLLTPVVDRKYKKLKAGQTKAQVRRTKGESRKKG